MAEGIYLRWGARRNRADDLAKALDVRLVALRWQSSNPAIVPIRYIVQFLQTLGLLLWRRPKVVLSQHTHPFCSLAAVVYAAFGRCRVITDCHNAPFVDRVWRDWPIDVVNRFIYSRAALNLVHNRAILKYAVETLRLPGDFLVLHDAIPHVRDIDPSGNEGSGALVVCSFAADEPIEAIVEATRLAPDIRFRITGNRARLGRSSHAGVGENVTFTGFVSNSEYDRMLASAEVVIALSTRNNVLMRACHEAIGAGVPLVTSDSPTAREYFSEGTIFVRNEAEDIAVGTRTAIDAKARLRAEMGELRRLRREQWLRELEPVRELIRLCEHPKVP